MSLEDSVYQQLQNFSISEIYQPRGAIRCNAKLAPLSDDPDAFYENVFEYQGIRYETGFKNRPVKIFLFPSILLNNTIAGKCFSAMTGDDLTEIYQTKTLIYAGNGRCVSNGAFAIASNGPMCFVTILVDSIQKDTGIAPADFTDFGITLFNNPIKESGFKFLCKSYVPELSTDINGNTTAATDITAAQTLIDKQRTLYGKNALIFVNGFIYTEDLPPLTSDDDITILAEVKTGGSFIMDIDSGNTGYQSDFYSGYRELLLSPFANQEMFIPHDLVEVYIIDKETGRMLYYPRIDVKSIRQVTFACYSCDRDLAVKLKTELHISHMQACVRLMPSSAGKKYRPDANYTHLLHTLPEDQTIGYLRGILRKDADFWQAANVEKTNYLDIVFRDGLPDDLSYPVKNLTVPDLKFYIDAYGWYNTIAICKGQMGYGKYYPDLYEWPLSPVQRNYTLFPKVFANGLLLSASRYRYTQDTDTVKIFFEDPGYQSGVDLKVEGFPLQNGVTKFIPTEGDNTVVIDSPANSVYLYDTDTGDYTALSQGPSTWVPKPVDPKVDGYTVWFSSTLYGKIIILTETARSYQGELVLDNFVSQCAPMIVSLPDEKQFPYLNAQTVDLYLNGYFLVEGVDWIRYGVNRVVVTNYAYLRPASNDPLNPNNLLHYFVSATERLSNQSGYLFHQRLEVQNPKAFFYENVSMFYRAGRMKDTIIDEGKYLFDPTSSFKDRRAICNYQLEAPDSLIRLLDSVASSEKLEDTYRVRIIQQILPEVKFEEGLPVTYSQDKIYSPWLTMIIYQTAIGEYVPVDLLDDNQFIENFPDYNGLKEIDPAVNQVEGVLMDRYSVAVSACYGDALKFVSSPKSVKLLERLVRLTLKDSYPNIGHTLI